MKKIALFRRARRIVCTVTILVFSLAGAGFAWPVVARGALIPSILSGGTWALVLWILAALLGGRVYCSCFCPLGVLQDTAVFFHRQYRPRKNRKILRCSVLAAAVIPAAAGLILPAAGLDPYSIFGRFGDRLLRPAVTGLTGFCWGTLRMESVTPLEPHIFLRGLFFWSCGVLLVLWLFALKFGRWYCDMICPAGTLLGMVSQYSRYAFTLDPDKCRNCGKCEKICRTGAISLKEHKINVSRCILCGDCAAGCPFGSITFSRRRKSCTAKETPALPERREFLLAAGAAGLAAAAGAAGLRKGTAPDPMPVMPPGAKDWATFHARCTGCGLCAAGCSGKTLSPAGLEYGLSGIGQMRLDFSIGRCDFECHRCSKVCPTGALQPMTAAAKKRRKIGSVRFYRERCLVVKNQEDCGACAEHCPTGALQMVPFRGTLTVPKVLPELCIGCGSCQYICPVRPLQAMRVTGEAVQTVAADPESVLKKDTVKARTAEFPF